MGSRPRIRWPNAARLALGVIACAALLVALPSLIRRPKPPPLQPDIGLPPASSAPAEGVFASRRQAERRPRTGHPPERRARPRKPKPATQPSRRSRHGRAEAPAPTPAASTVSEPSPTTPPSPPAPAAPPPQISPPDTSPPPDPAPAPGHPSEFSFER